MRPAAGVYRVPIFLSHTPANATVGGKRTQKWDTYTSMRGFLDKLVYLWDCDSLFAGGDADGASARGSSD